MPKAQPEPSKGRKARRPTQPVTCPECQKTIGRKADLERHKQMHRNEHNFKCPVPTCTFSAIQRNNLATHLKTHTGEKPFRCEKEGCLFAASDPANLSRHRKRGKHQFQPKARKASTRERTSEEVRIASEYLEKLRRTKGSRSVVKEASSVPEPAPIPVASTSAQTPERPYTPAPDVPYLDPVPTLASTSAQTPERHYPPTPDVAYPSRTAPSFALSSAQTSERRYSPTPDVAYYLDYPAPTPVASTCARTFERQRAPTPDLFNSGVLGSHHAANVNIARPLALEVAPTVYFQQSVPEEFIDPRLLAMTDPYYYPQVPPCEVPTAIQQRGVRTQHTLVTGW